MQNDDTQPATKGDLRLLATKADMDRRFEYVNDAIDRVLAVVVNMDKKLIGILSDHEMRIKRLEQEVG